MRFDTRAHARKHTRTNKQKKDLKKRILKCIKTREQKHNSPQLHHTFSCSIPSLGRVSDKTKNNRKAINKTGRGRGRKEKENLQCLQGEEQHQTLGCRVL